MAGYVYILASRRHGTLYTGCTTDLAQRVYQHREEMVAGFTAKYGVKRLVWFETYDDVSDAIVRERRIKVEAELEGGADRAGQPVVG